MTAPPVKAAFAVRQPSLSSTCLDVCRYRAAGQGYGARSPGRRWLDLGWRIGSRRQGCVRISMVKTGVLAGRVGLLSAVTLAEVVLGLLVVRPFVGVARGLTFPGWLWPTLCIVGLSLIWLYAAWSFVIRPVRFERRFGAIRHHLDPTVTTTRGAEGWYQDPYRIHQYRWFSMGKPSALVRDGLIESNDAPPDMPYVGTVVPEEDAAGAGANGADLRRAGDGKKRDGWDAASDASTWFPLN